MSFTLQAFKEDALASDMTDSASSLTLVAGAFGTPTGEQMLVIDPDIAAKREIVKCTIDGATVTSVDRAQDGTSAVAHSSGAKVIMAFVPSHYTEVTNKMASIDNGWVDADETWTYVSVDDPTGVIKVQADVTAKYSAGMRVKMTNATNTVYGIITAVGTYGGDAEGYTYITFLHEIDPTDSLALHLLADSAITANYYSVQKAPFGFPLDPTKWTVKATSTTNRLPSPSTSYVSMTDTIVVPIGVWILLMRVNAVIDSSSTNAKILTLTLSSDAETETDTDTTVAIRHDAESATAASVSASLHSSAITTVAAKTTFTLIGKVNNTSDVSNAGTQGSTDLASVYRAVSAYI